MADQQPKKRKPLSESAIIRRFCYSMFAASSLMLMLVLSMPGWNWRPALVGTLIYGGLSVLMYRQEERRKENIAVTRQAQQARAGSFDFSDDEDEDPTTPPTRIR